MNQGIRIDVSTVYLSDQSAPAARRYAFSYTIRIVNDGSAPAKLISRHWIITNGDGTIQEVRGEGVVGHQPHLTPGQSFEYTSGCVLDTPQGTMHGAYQMVRDDGGQFDAEIAPFLLALPNSLN